MIKNSREVPSIKYIDYLFIIFTILINNSVYMYHSTLFHLIILVGWQALLFFIGFRSMLNNENSQDTDKLYFLIFIYLFVSLGILACYYLYYPFPLHDSLLFSLDPIMLIIYFYNTSYRMKKINNSLLYKFEKVMLFLASISLICYLLYLIGLPPIGFHLSYYWGKMYDLPSYFGLCFPPARGEKIILFSLRNVGIFTEGPVYSYILCVAFFIELFIHKHDDHSKYREAILFITIISTQSTNGIVLSLIALILKELESGSSYVKKWIVLVISPIFVIVIVYIIKLKKYLSNNSVAAFSNVNSSYNIRTDNVVASLHAWSNNLLFGNGLENKSAIYKYINPLRFNGGDIGITASFFEVLACGGIVLSLFYIIPTILACKIAPNIRNFAIINFMYFMVEGLMKYYIFYIFLSYGVACYLLYKSRRNKLFNFDNTLNKS